MAQKNGFKMELFGQFARIGKAMSSANRLELLEFLAQGERCVEDLATVAGLSVANTSHHLQQLRQAGLIACRKEGLRVFYRLSGDDVLLLLNAQRQVAERHLAEVKQLVQIYLDSKDQLEPMARAQLLEYAHNGLVTVLDVRPRAEFDSGHLPGAVNIPLAELESRLQELPPDQEVIAYCRGPHCILAFEAVARLRNEGFEARRLEDGFPEWKLQGLPVDSTGKPEG